MRRWLSRLVAWLRPEAVLSPLPAPPPSAPWQRIDRETWTRILQSDTGRRLLARARAVHYQMLRSASADHFHAAQAVHAARGFEEAITWLESLAISSAPDASGASAIGGPGEGLANETPEQASERELRELIARSSP